MARLGRAYALSGRRTEGLVLLEQAVEQVSAGSTFGMAGACAYVLWLAEAYLLAGRADDAAQTASHALSSARECQERGTEAWARRLLGEIAAHGHPPDADEAESYYREALALADELGMRPLVAHCHRGLGTLYRQVDRDEHAKAELNTATELYRAMEMAFWLEKAEAVLAQVGAA